MQRLGDARHLIGTAREVIEATVGDDQRRRSQVLADARLLQVAAAHGGGLHRAATSGPRRRQSFEHEIEAAYRHDQRIGPRRAANGQHARDVIDADGRGSWR